MRPARSFLAAAAVAALTVGPLAALAGAAPSTGVGTGSVSSTALSVQLGANGDVLSVRILGDDGTSTIDPAKGAPSSTETLTPLVVSSKAVPALNFSTPSIATSSKGNEDRKSLPDAGLPQTPVFAGSVNALLSSVVDASGARSGLQAGLANLRVAGGLVNVPTGVVQVASQAAGASATGSRSITIPNVNVLDLSAVLDGLGLKLTDLPVITLLALLGKLGIALPDVSDPSAAVAGLNSTIDLLQAKSGPLTSAICSTVDGLLAPLGGVTGLVGGVLGNLPNQTGVPTGSLPQLPTAPTQPGSTVPLAPITTGLGSIHLLAADADLDAAAISCTSLTGTVTDLLAKVRSSLGDLLAGVLVTLDSAPLLSVNDVHVGLVATATDTLGKCVADVTASIGSVKVGALPVPQVGPLDLTAPAAVINQASAAIQGAVGSVLGTLNASLANLVKVDVLQIQKSVAAVGGYNNATSSVTALRATLDPTGLLEGAALLDLSAAPVSSVLGGIGAAVPTLAPLMGQLEASLGGLQALTGVSVVTVGQLSSSAAYRATVSGSPSGTLPHTGRDAGGPALLAVVLGGIALAVRRTLRTAKA